MRLKPMKELLGGEVLAHDGRIGALYDVYFERDSGQVRYLVVANKAPAPRHLLVSAGIARQVGPRGGVLVALSRAQLQCGAGAWSLERARPWLDHGRLCSGSEVLGFGVEAQDGSAGRLADLLIDGEAWSIDYVIVDSQAGDLSHQVLLPLHWVAAIDVARKALRVRRTRDELRSSPGP